MGGDIAQLPLLIGRDILCGSARREVSQDGSVEPGRLTIRQAMSADAGELAYIQAAAAIGAYRGMFPPSAPKPTPEALLSSWQRLLEHRSVDVLVAVVSVPVGSVVIRPSAEVPHHYLLERLYVDPRWWGLGVGARLHDAGLAVAARHGVEAINLWVLEGNTRARSMYERRGWVLNPDHTFTHATGLVEVQYRRNLHDV